MLEKTNRLTKRKEFNYVYKHGETKYSKYLKLYFVSSYNKKVRIGISVSNKIGNAVTRNKIKRQLRVLLRELLPKLKEKTNYIFVAKEGITNLGFLDLKTDLIKILNFSNLIDNSKNDIKG